MIDYRNTCAMINFDHKTCCADQKIAKELAQRLRDKCENVRTNLLESIRGVRFGTKSLPYINISDVIDFPKLSEKKLVLKLFFGNYYIKLAKSYISDILKNGKCCVLSKISMNKKSADVSVSRELTSQLDKTKIVGFEIVSRHRRSEYNANEGIDKNEYVKKFKSFYKVLVQYAPNTNNTKAIKGTLLQSKQLSHYIYLYNYI
jgi:hypothetical protein